MKKLDATRQALGLYVSIVRSNERETESARNTVDPALAELAQWEHDRDALARACVRTWEDSGWCPVCDTGHPEHHENCPVREDE